MLTDDLALRKGTNDEFIYKSTIEAITQRVCDTHAAYGRSTPTGSW